jgi:DNA polymerase-3 subunit alpha
MNQCFISLRSHTAYSLLEGALRIKELAELCKLYKMPAIGISDTNNMFASLEFSKEMLSAGIQPIIGVQLSFKPYGFDDARNASQVKPEQLVLIAKDNAGYRNLLALVSKAYLQPAGGIAPLLSYSDLVGFSDGVIALTGGIHGGIGRALLSTRAPAAESLLALLKEYFGDRLYIEIMRHGLEDERRIESALLEIAQAHNLPIVATNDMYFATADQYEAHDALMCIAEGTYVVEQDRRRLTPQHRFKSPQEMQALFADLPEAIHNTVNIAKRCAVMSEARDPILPRFEVRLDDGSLMSEDDILRDRARTGLEQRLEDHVYKEGMDEEARAAIRTQYVERLEYELSVIIKMQFPGYFLIVSDFISWSKSKNIPVGPGRGSGAGSLVAWALLITDLDPLRYGLLFERFLNPERVSMPDFDVDFCQDRRDEVIKYVQDKYGFDRVAQIITFGKLQARAVLRDVGRVLQLPYNQVDGICKLVPNNPAHPVTLQEAIDVEPMLKAAIKQEESVERMVGIALKLEGLNRHASTHAAGVVIADRPLQELVPLYRDAKSTMLVVQYSMKYAEMAGLVKFDFLGLKTLSVLQKAVELVAHRGITLDLLKLPEGDKKTYAMLGQGDATGVFQLESAGMRDTLRKLKPDCLEDIIALVSLYRPGPMENIPTYIARKHGHEQPEYLHPKLETVLKETFGVIIYQEQVMQIAQLLAGYSLGEADLLRRAMGKKIRAEMEAQREIFVGKAVALGVEEEQARSIFDLIAKFAEYGFNKSHAAAYAVIAYQTAFLKANYPVEFLAASMIYDMHNTDKLSVFREEALRNHIPILPPDINRSEALFSVEQLQEGKVAIRYALGALRNVGIDAMHQIVAARGDKPFKDIFDFLERVDSSIINKRQFEFMVKAGAFDSIHRNRKQLLESLDMLIAYNQSQSADKNGAQVSLFSGGAGVSRIQPKLAPIEDSASLERLEAEFEAVGFYLSAHPLQGYGHLLKKSGVTLCSQFPMKIGEKYSSIKVAGIVISTKMKVSQKGRFAFLTLSDETGNFEISIFKEELLTSFRDLLVEGTLLMVTADAKMDENGARLIATSFQKLDALMAQWKAQPQGIESGQVDITVQNADALASLRERLGKPCSVGSKVRLHVVTPTGIAVMSLTGLYNISAATTIDIQTIEGVSVVDKAA